MSRSVHVASRGQLRSGQYLWPGPANLQVGSRPIFPQYFLARLYPDNPRQNQQIDGLGPGISQGPGAGVRRRAGGQDVIDQQNPRALGHLGPGGMEGESARDVAMALAAAEVTLGWRRAAP